MNTRIELNLKLMSRKTGVDPIAHNKSGHAAHFVLEALAVRTSMTTESEIKEFIAKINSPYLLMAMDRFIKEALEGIGVSKSKGNPVGEYAEYLAAQALQGERMLNAKEGHDLTLPDGSRIEVKGRVFEGTRIPMTYIKDSTIKQNTFDYLVYIVLSENMNVKYAMKISHENFQKIAKYTEPKNSPPKWTFVAKQQLLSDERVEDITTEIIEAAIA